MKKIGSLIGFLAMITAMTACKKNNATTDNCFQNDTTTRQIINKPAVITASNGQFYIVEQGAIDTKLKPCNLEPDFRTDGLQVTVSGDVKTTVHENSAPCCTENFVITNIY